MLLCFVQVGFWIELPVQRKLRPVFIKIMDLGKWDIAVRYWLTRFPQVDDWSTDPRVLGRHS